MLANSFVACMQSKEVSSTKIPKRNTGWRDNVLSSIRKFQAMNLAILLALLPLLKSYQSLRRATMRLLIYSNQEKKICGLPV